jgi:hypothetical protein
MWKVLTTIFMGFICATNIFAQPVITPKNLALGGGGTTYITDFNANFYNPANLLINDRKKTVDIGFLSGASTFNGVLNFENPDDQKDNFLKYFDKFSSGDYNLTPANSELIIDTHYKRERLNSVHQSRFEVTTFGVNWINNNRAYSIAARTRVGSSFEAGRNWYTDQLVVENNIAMSNQNLVHRYQVLHEFSFGYSESASLINGLSSRLDNFLIGFAPKFILAGPYQNTEWRNGYSRENGSTVINRSQVFNHQSAGSLTEATQSYMNGVSANQSVDQSLEPFKDELTNIHGYGAGVDVGFTYLLTFGSDLSTLSTNEQPIKRSIRLSFSINDIGFVNYSDKTLQLEETRSNSTSDTFPAEASEYFAGAPGQYINFVEQQGDGDPFADNSANFETGSFSTLLPTSFNGGILIELNRIKVMGDMSIGISNNAFNSTRLVTSLGAELRPLNFLPLRGGLQFGPGLPGSFNVGTAIETRFWDLSLGLTVSARSFTTATNLAGAGVAVLQFHL